VEPSWVLPPNCLSRALSQARRVLGGRLGGTYNLTTFLLSGDFYATFSKKVAKGKRR